MILKVSKENLLMNKSNKSKKCNFPSLECNAVDT